MDERMGASHQAARYLPFEIDENPEKQAARYGTVEQDERDGPSARITPRPAPQQVELRRKVTAVEEGDALHVVPTPRSISADPSQGRSESPYYSSAPAIGPEDDTGEPPSYEVTEYESGAGSPRSESQNEAAPQPQKPKQAGHRQRQQRKRNEKEQDAKGTRSKGKRPRRHHLLRHRPTRRLWRIVRSAATEPMARAAADRPELQKTAAYTTTAIRSGSFVSRLVSRAASRAIRIVLSVKFIVPLLLILVLAVAVPAAFTSANSLSSDSSDGTELSDTYEYITRLDADTERSIRQSCRQHDVETVCVNGLEIPLSQLQIQTNIDYLLMYLQTKYDTLQLNDRIDGHFGGNRVKTEIKAIHDALYTWQIETQEIVPEDENEDGSDEDSEDPAATTVSIVKLTVHPLASYIASNDQLTDDESEWIRLISSFGTYMATSSIGAPFDGYYYIKDRWGWYVNDNGQLAQRKGVTVLPYGSSRVFSCAAGSVTEVSGSRVSVRTGEDTIRYSNLQSVSVEVGQLVQPGQPIGDASYSTGLYLEFYLGNKAINPLFLLPTREPGSGDGSALVAVAAEQIGNVGGQPYWSWYGFAQRVDWCAIFVSWCANEISVLDAAVPRYASVSSGATWFRARGQWQYSGTYIPQAGDIVFFDWENDGSLDHTGIVEDCDGVFVHTIEGNSGDYPGTCRRKDYSVSSPVIVGYGIPEY